MANVSDRWLTLPDEILAVYNAHDTVVTARLAARLRAELAQNNQLEFYEREVWSNLPAVLAMQRRGLPYDTAAKGLYRRRLRAELAEVDDALRAAFAATAAPPPDFPGVLVGRLWAWMFPTKRTRRRALFTKTEWPKVSKWTAEGFNPNSDAQVRDWLFNRLGLKPSTHTETKLPSVDQDALQRVLQRKPASTAEARRVEAATPVLHNLMHRSRLAKIDEDYLDPEVIYDRPEVHGNGADGCSQHPTRGVPSRVSDPRGERQDVGVCRVAQRSDGTSVERGSLIGRVFPTIKMVGTKSGRFAYADPPVHSWPPEIRHFVRARPGYLILSPDMRAIESRIFTLLTRDLIDGHIFEMNAKDPANPEWDIHIRTACDLFAWNLPTYLSFDEAKREGSRNASKGFRYGVIQYGGQPETAKTKVFCPCPRCADKAPPTLDLTPAQKKAQAERWFRKHYWAREWRREVSLRAARDHRLTDVMGKVTYFHAPWSDETEREAWNSQIQPVATTILRRGMRRLHALGAPLILEHHDALYLEIPEADVAYWAAAVRNCLEAPVPEFGGYSFPTEIKVGPSWGQLKKLITTTTNPAHPTHN